MPPCRRHIDILPLVFTLPFSPPTIPRRACFRRDDFPPSEADEAMQKPPRAARPLILRRLRADTTHFAAAREHAYARRRDAAV